MSFLTIKLESISKVRRETVEKLLTVVYKYSQAGRYELSNSKICKEVYDGDKCDALSYGSTTLALSKANLWPRKTSDQISSSSWSVKRLAADIGDTKVLVATSIKMSNTMYRSDYTKCYGCDFKSKVEDVMSRIQSPVLDSHRVHMKGQRGERV